MKKREYVVFTYESIRLKELDKCVGEINNTLFAHFSNFDKSNPCEISISNEFISDLTEIFGTDWNIEVAYNPKSKVSDQNSKTYNFSPNLKN